MMAIGRRKNASERLPLTTTSNNESASATNARQQPLPALKRARSCCSYRSAVVACATTALYILVTTYIGDNLFSLHSTAAHPCRVALETASSYKRMEATQDSAQLPKIIHHQWKTTDIPDKYKKWHETWYSLYPEPEYKHMLWTDESARTFIQKHYSWFLPTFDAYQYPIQRADAVRYFYLHYYGGLHTDLDYEPLSRDIFNHLPQTRVGLVESPYKFSEETQNSFMSSPKGNAFWLDVFDLLEKNKDKRVLGATGPQLLDKAIRSSSHDVFILPCENFHRIPLNDKKESPFVTRLVRGVLARLYPMKQCGNFHDTSADSCQFAQHHNTAVYVAESTWWDLLVNL